MGPIAQLVELPLITGWLGVRVPLGHHFFLYFFIAIIILSS